MKRTRRIRGKNVVEKGTKKVVEKKNLRGKKGQKGKKRAGGRTAVEKTFRATWKAVVKDGAYTGRTDTSVEGEKRAKKDILAQVEAWLLKREKKSAIKEITLNKLESL